jgi:sulfate adenylyltransferase
MSLITPHGGTLVNRILGTAAAAAATAEAASVKTIVLSPREQCDLEMIAIGAFSPLKGFMGQEDFSSVCRRTRLADGTVWPIPVTLCVSEAVGASFSAGETIALKDE